MATELHFSPVQSSRSSRLRRDDEQRPLLAGDDPAARIEALRAARAHLYRALAHQTIDTSGLELAQVAACILEGYRSYSRTGN